MSTKNYIACFLSTIVSMELGIYVAATRRYWICALMVVIGISGTVIAAYMNTRNNRR